MFIGHNTDKLQNEYVLHQQTCNYTVQTYGLAVTWAFHCPLVRVALLVYLQIQNQTGLLDLVKALMGCRLSIGTLLQ